MDNKTLALKTLHHLESVYMIFSQYTRMPYVECDSETFDDQVHILASEDEAQAFTKEHTEKKIALVAQKIPNDKAPGVLVSMYALGANAVVFHYNGTTETFQLEQLVKKPTFDKALAEKLPIMNPTLTLSTLYFLQELHRPVAHDKKQLKALEDEMIVNLLRSKYILATAAANPGEKLDPKNPKQPKCINYIKNKEGKLFLPVCSDVSEFQKFYQKKASELGMTVVTFTQLLKHLSPEAKGVVLNPASFALQIQKEQLEKIMQSL